jgi:exonuclease VII large subunit
MLSLLMRLLGKLEGFQQKHQKSNKYIDDMVAVSSSEVQLQQEMQATLQHMQDALQNIIQVIDAAVPEETHERTLEEVRTIAQAFLQDELQVLDREEKLEELEERQHALSDALGKHYLKERTSPDTALRKRRRLLKKFKSDIAGLMGLFALPAGYVTANKPHLFEKMGMALGDTMPQIKGLRKKACRDDPAIDSAYPDKKRLYLGGTLS